MSESVDRLLGEGLMKATDATRQAGVRVSVWTILRWIRRGVGSQRLEAVKVGGRWFTSLPAVKRFLAASTQPARRGRIAPRELRPSLAAERYLDSLGLGRCAGGDA